MWQYARRLQGLCCQCGRPHTRVRAAINAMVPSVYAEYLCRAAMRLPLPAPRG